jgi:hypothetical protein
VGGGAANAVDGVATIVHEGRKCTETKSEQSPWWTVDLLTVQVTCCTAHQAGKGPVSGQDAGEGAAPCLSPAGCPSGGNEFLEMSPVAARPGLRSLQPPGDPRPQSQPCATAGRGARERQHSMMKGR